MEGKLSPVLHRAGVSSSWLVHWGVQALYVLVARLWLIPDRRIERAPAEPPLRG